MLVYGPHPEKAHTVGGKAAGLYKLLAIGIAVPPFLVITAETFDPILQHLPSDLPAMDQRKRALETFTLSSADQAALDQRLADWGFPNQAVVVRSSIADEDGETHAFPGLMDSFLNLTSLPAVYEAIGRCAASAYADRAVAYRQQKGLTLTARPAVIIQQQASPVASGVLFSTFPDYPQEMAIHATFGFSEALLGGRQDADEFYFLKQSKQLHRTVLAAKTEQLTTQPGSGLTPVAVPPDKQAVPCLTPDQLAGLFQLGTTLETALAHPQDVEFVVTDNQIFVVQSRPITQPIPEVIVYDNSNIQESYCGVTTPLTFSFASRAYATVYRQTMQTLGLSPVLIRAQEPVVTNLLGLVKGRIYYQINNWYRGLQLLPSFRQNKADMERMMGLDEPVDFVTDRQKTIAEQVRLLPGLVVNLSRLLWAFSRLRHTVPAFHRHFAEQYHRFYRQLPATLRSDALLTEKHLLDKDLLGNWATPIINDFYVMMANGRAIRQLRKAGIATPDEFLSRYLSGDTQLESTRPVWAMQQLAAQAHGQTDLRNLILAQPADLHQQTAAAFPDFYRAVNQFIDQYGDRTVGELKLETVTMRLAPSVFYQYLRNYLSADPPAESPAGPSRLHTEARAELTRRLANRPVFVRRRVWSTLAKLRQAIRYREALRLERTRLFGMYRALYLSMGEWLVQKQALPSPADVFYLTEDEITTALRSGQINQLAALAANRRLVFAGYETEDAPSRVTVPSPPVDQPLPVNQPGRLRGTGCVGGLVTGPVIVITDPRDALDVTGKIVCALRTDPGWAVLFPTCRAVLIEKGSALSHSVILLRELGLPTIINIPGLTKTLTSGQTVTIDGSSGDVTLLPYATH